ncbi:MAG: hypothetical protein ACR2OX_10075 [Methyloligellaceae bacterium]
MQIVTYFAAFVFVLALIGVGAWVLRTFMLRNGSQSMRFFAPKEKRLGVVEATSVDNRRKLILVRRDETEHLIMTGGPVDVLIETNISPDSALGGALSVEPASETRSAIIARGEDRLEEDDA